ncbi:MAG: tetratricopeptide repeat protein, partial [Planctomycetota bacterium]
MRAVALVLALSALLAFPVALAQDDVEKAVARATELQKKKEFEGAMELLREALAKHPGDARILLELGRTAHFQATEILKRRSPTLGRLALLDAMKWYQRAVEAKPDWP